jgi:RND family efflux transporter MFP subunit
MAKAVHVADPMRAVVAFALLASLSSCKKKEEAVTKAPSPPVAVPLEAVGEAPAPRVLTLTGLIAADQRSEVTADTQGKVLAVLVDRGQRVKMGQPVVQLDVRTQALSAREAQANLETARAQKQLAEEECKRAQTLLDKGAITRSEYDRQITQCTSTLQQVSAAQARADMISKSVSDGLVRAPFDGQVTEKSVAPGEWVAPGRTLFTLVDDDPLKIELSVPEAAVPAMQKGQKVDVTAIARPGKSYAAKVTRVGGEIGKNRALIAEATLDPQSDLVPGMFVEARVTIGEVPRPVVPATALVQRGKLWHAFVAVHGELKEQIVQRGPDLDGGRVAILQGVTRGDQVVIDAKADRIEDGLRVVQPEAPAKGGKTADGKAAPAEDGKSAAAAKSVESAPRDPARAQGGKE